mgnify:CR=1 FL=1
MKKYFLSAVLSLSILPSSFAGELPEKVDYQIRKIINRIREKPSEETYGPDDFLKDLKGIEGTKKLLQNIKKDPEVSLLKIKLIELGLSVQKRENNEKIGELRRWYACYAHELPDDLFHIRWPYLGKKGRASLEEHREFMKKQAGFSRSAGQGEELRDNHLDVSYLTAWKFWLIAPPFKEKEMMHKRVVEAIRKIGNGSAIPFLVEAMKNSEEAETNKERKIGVIISFIDIISDLPGEEALEALLEINRDVIEKNLNEKNYYKSISRHIIRRLASRRAYADALIDPEMREVFERKGYNEKPEDIPLTDKNWKVYKPLLEKKLKEMVEQGPQASVEILRSALEIMPSQ